MGLASEPDTSPTSSSLGTPPNAATQATPPSSPCMRPFRRLESPPKTATQARAPASRSYLVKIKRLDVQNDLHSTPDLASEIEVFSVARLRAVQPTPTPKYKQVKCRVTSNGDRRFKVVTLNLTRPIMELIVLTELRVRQPRNSSTFPNRVDV